MAYIPSKLVAGFCWGGRRLTDDSATTVAVIRYVKVVVSKIVRELEQGHLRLEKGDLRNELLVRESTLQDERD
jgi:hypothetical protein